jgi:anti-sigma B factor antagonist
MVDRLKIRQLDGVTILDVTGALALPDDAWQVMATGSTRILLNMARMKRIDSHGIGELVAAYTSVIRAGGQMKLLRVRPLVKDVLDAAGLCTVLEMYEDETAAVRSFAGAQPPGSGGIERRDPELKKAS